MPYISNQRREALNTNQTPLSAGELNYQITNLLVGYLEADRLSYSRINDILGALEGAKLEFYKRVAEPYEYFKKSQNGDIDYYENVLSKF